MHEQEGTPLNRTHHLLSYSERSKQKTLGQFNLGDKLGQGAFGFVRLGKDTLTGENVAVKEYERAKIVQKADKVRIDREIAILQTIRHCNIIQLYSVIHSSSHIFFIMEYASGKELSAYIKSKQRINEVEACRIFQQIISGIDYLQKSNIAHRDIKPDNILLDDKHNVKLIDFGLSNIYAKGDLLSTACGSPFYAAPEMLTGKKYRPNPIDIWASGVVLFLMLTGHLPFEDENNDSLYKKIAEGKFVLPHFLSDQAKSILRRLLTTNPGLRITIKQIKEHSWFNLVPQDINILEGLFIDVNVIPIDEEIVSSMKQYNFSKEDIREAVLSNKHNNITTVYYLLLNRKVRMGIPSVSDMKSREYYDYIANRKNLMRRYDNNLEFVLKERRSSKGQWSMPKEDEMVGEAHNRRSQSTGKDYCNASPLPIFANKPRSTSTVIKKRKMKSSSMILKSPILSLKEFKSMFTLTKEAASIQKLKVKKKNSSMCFSERKGYNFDTDISLLENKLNAALIRKERDNANSINDMKLLTETVLKKVKRLSSLDSSSKIQSINQSFKKELMSFRNNVGYEYKSKADKQHKRVLNRSIPHKSKILLSLEANEALKQSNAYQQFVLNSERKNVKVEDHLSIRLSQGRNGSNANGSINRGEKKAIALTTKTINFSVKVPPILGLKELKAAGYQTANGPLMSILTENNEHIKGKQAVKSSFRNENKALTTRMNKQEEDLKQSFDKLTTLEKWNPTNNMIKAAHKTYNAIENQLASSPLNLSCIIIKSINEIKREIGSVLSQNKVKHKQSTKNGYKYLCDKNQFRFEIEIKKVKDIASGYILNTKYHKCKAKGIREFVDSIISQLLNSS